MHTFHDDTKVFTDTPMHYTTITLLHLIHFAKCVWVCNVGWTTRACQVFSAAPALFEPLAPFNHCCTLQLSPCTCFIWEWMPAGLATSAQRNWMKQQCACLDKSMTVLCATHSCSDMTENSLLMMCAYRGGYWTLLDWTKITQQYKLSAYLSYNPYTILLCWFCSSVAICLNGAHFSSRQIPKVKPKNDSSTILKNPKFCLLPHYYTTGPAC